MRWITAILSIFGIVGAKERRQRREAEMRFREDRARLEAQKGAEAAKVANACRHLTGASWRDPVGKTEFAQEVYDGKIPSYLWYDLEDAVLSEADTAEITRLFWGENGRSLGDLEIHRSLNSGIYRGLRVRNPKTFVDELVVGDKTFPLYQTGAKHVGEPAVLFLDLVPRPKTTV